MNGVKGSRWEELVSWCFEPSQPLGVTSGLNTNSNLSLSRREEKENNNKRMKSTHLSLLLSDQLQLSEDYVTKGGGEGGGCMKEERKEIFYMEPDAKNKTVRGMRIKNL